MAKTMNEPSEIETKIRTRYSSTRFGLPDDMPITVLHIGADRTVVASGKGIGPDAIVALEIGSQKTSTDFFKHNPPTPAELENAIMFVEDELARTRASIAEGSTLFTTDAAVHEIALIAGVSDQSVLILPVETMERTF